MEIILFQPDMAAGVAACYNDTAAAVPYCRPVPAETFINAETIVSPYCGEEAIFVARQAGGDISGFVHVGIAMPPTEEWQPHGRPGVIRFLAYRPGERIVGDALLQAAEAWLRERERPEIIAWHMLYAYPFYHLSRGSLSERLMHVTALLHMAGYQVMGETETYYEWRDFTPPKIDVSGHLFDEKIIKSSDYPNNCSGIRVELTSAIPGGTLTSSCTMMHVRPDWCFCGGLGVAGPLQSHNLGKYLLARGLEEMHKAGCRHAAISTGSANYRAQLFYSNFGFTFSDRTFYFNKPLS